MRIRLDKMERTRELMKKKQTEAGAGAHAVMQLQVRSGGKVAPAGLRDAGFRSVELKIPFDREVWQRARKGMEIVGVYVEPKVWLAAEIFEESLQFYCGKSLPDYLVLGTEKLEEQLSGKCNEAIEGARDAVKQAVYRACFALRDYRGRIFLENGYEQQGTECVSGVCSEAGFLKELLEEPLLDEQRAKFGGRFGVCLNVGHANLLARNIVEDIRTLGDKLCLLHINDNDGRTDQHQMPCTFTTGRGIPSTDWYGIVKALAEIDYRGDWCFDTVGLFVRAPQKLHRPLCSLQYSLYKEWSEQVRLEEKLAQNRQIILFGAGNMFCNYMKCWGKKYPPAFVVDNNSAIWGQERQGIEVCSPRKIMEIPEKQRFVLICNIYYRQIEEQLRAMGVEAQWYIERYFL